MPITADADYYISDATGVHFRGVTTKIVCPFAVDMNDVTAVDIQVWNTALDVFYGSNTVRFSESELEAYTGSGTGEFTQMKSVVEQAVKGYLDGRGGNSGVVTFTIV